MFSFLSNWRLPQVSSKRDDDDGDDASSLNRSLNLPWPVTESSSRKSNKEWTPPQHQQASVRDISGPIPRTATNSLSSFSEHPYAQGKHHQIGAPPLLPLHQQPTAPEPVTWYQDPADKRQKDLRMALLQAQAHAHLNAHTNGPPEVVRLDNVMPNGDTRDQPPPTYSSAYASSTSGSGSNLHLNQLRPQVHKKPPQIGNINDGEHKVADEHELYTSPFGHSDDDAEDASFRTPSVKSSTPSSSRWGGLKLHTASPFSSSTHSLKDPSHPLAPQSGAQPARTLQPVTPPVHPTQPAQASILPPSVNTDVYNHAYSYPMVKQLSPIAEQDYFSPISSRGLPGSAVTGSSGASPGAESVLNFSSGIGKDKGEGTEREGPRERDSVRTRTGSMRAGSGSSVGSVRTPGGAPLSRAGSLSMSVRDAAAAGLIPSPSPGGSVGSEVARPSPIYASPFIARHLNRTVSQTSSTKSESPMQAQFQAQGQSQPSTPQLQSHTPAYVQTVTTLTPSQSRGLSHLSTGSSASTPRASATTISNSNINTNLQSVSIEDSSVQMPTHAASPTATSTTTTTGTMYTPTSAFPIPTPTSTTVQVPPVALTIPSIPPLDFRPFFPGPHPSPPTRDGHVPQLRPPKSAKKKGDVHQMSAVGSVERQRKEDVEDDEGYADEYGEDETYDVESLHADSFVTATTNSNEGFEHERADEAKDDDEHGLELAELRKGKGVAAATTTAAPGSVHSKRSGVPLPVTSIIQSGSGGSAGSGSATTATGESFIARRWERDAALGLSFSPTTFREKKSLIFGSSSSSSTPAFWAFWLGFVFPVLWLVGGWHFTHFGEQPPRSSVWEWYFWNEDWLKWVGGRIWYGVFRCCIRRKGSEGALAAQGRGVGEQDHQHQLQMQRRTKRTSRGQSKLRAGKVFPALPRWVAEKQSSDDGRMRLNDPKRSLRGISFGYPFVSRPTDSQENSSSPSPFVRMARMMLAVLEKPNRVLDHLYGVKLTEVRGRPESGRRMFDPWIQRCRYAFCWAMLLLAVGLCTACAYLIVKNTRRVIS